MRERRFFLYRKDERSNEGDLGHSLDPDVFGPALKLDENVRAAYTQATRQAEQTILDTERELGVKEPNLDGNKRLVQCNRYTGGLDICRVYPLGAFTTFVPPSRTYLESQETQRLMDGKTAGDYPRKILLALRDCARANAATIWKELETLQTMEPQSSCVVLLKTRFNPSEGYDRDDFLEGRLADIQLFPHAMGYLFYMYSGHTRIVQHDHVVFNSSRRSHVNVRHWTDGNLTLKFESEGGYECRVYIPLVL